MRTIGVVSAAAFLMACGGGEPAETIDSTTAPVVPVAGPTGTGARHEVEMVMEGTNYVYRPAALNIKAGDVVVFKGVSGGLHNVQFHPDSIPAGSQAALDAVIPNRMDLLATNLIVEGDSLVFTFSGVPAGRYPFFCMPHTAMGMFGAVTVEP